MKRNHKTQPKKRVSPQSFLHKLSKSDKPEGELAFREVPDPPDKHGRAHRTEKPWRVTLTPVETGAQPVALELHGDVVVGSSSEADPEMDVNLAEWDGDEHGVSAHHSQLHPTDKSLFVIDLKSSNGTYVNGMLVGTGQAQTLQDGDLITLGRLHLRLGVAQSP